jgi:hypothetical protein
MPSRFASAACVSFGFASRTSRSAIASSIALRSFRCRFSDSCSIERSALFASISPGGLDDRGDPALAGDPAGEDAALAPHEAVAAVVLLRDLDRIEDAELGDRRRKLLELADVDADVVADVDQLEQDVVEDDDRTRRRSARNAPRPLPYPRKASTSSPAPAGLSRPRQGGCGQAGSESGRTRPASNASARATR